MARVKLFAQPFRIQPIVSIGRKEAYSDATGQSFRRQDVFELLASWRASRTALIDTVKIAMFWDGRSICIDEYGNAMLDGKGGTIDMVAVERLLWKTVPRNYREPEIIYDVTIVNKSGSDLSVKSRRGSRLLSFVSTGQSAKFQTTSRLIEIIDTRSQSKYIALDRSYSLKKVRLLFRYDKPEQKDLLAVQGVRIVRRKSNNPRLEKILIRIQT